MDGPGVVAWSCLAAEGKAAGPRQARSDASHSAPQSLLRYIFYAMLATDRQACYTFQ
jgi:hypothetical protein